MSTAQGIASGSPSGITSATDTGTPPAMLTPKQEQQWSESMSHMMWKAPGFRHLFFKLLSESNKNGNAPYVAVIDPASHIAATNGRDIIINPDKFFEFSLAERTFILSHEVVHNVFNDVPWLKQCALSGKVPMADGTTMPFNNPSMQRAMDLRIDSLLIESGIGKAPKISIDRLAEHGCDTKETAHESVVELYKKVWKEDEEGGGGGFDQVLPPGNGQGQGNPPPSPQQWANEIAVAQQIEQMNRQQGKLPGALARLFKEILEPEIPWTEHIKGIVNRHVGSGNKTWKRPDRRFIAQDIYLPSASGFGCGWLVIGGDTSGSIGDAELCAYAAELRSIIEDCRPKRLTVVWWDTKVQHVEELESAADMDNLHPKGGGGSDSREFFQWIHDNSHEPPDMTVVFTDLCIRFPDAEPATPVIWASVEKNGTAPFGEVVFINQKKGKA